MFRTVVAFERCVFEVVKMSYYAVGIGRNTGVFHTWDECSAEVKGFPNARYKKFKTADEAWQFVQNFSAGSPKRKIAKVSERQDCGNFNNIVQSLGRKTSYYAVHRGKKPGVYRTWTECEMQIKGFNHPAYRKFCTEEEALEFVRTGGIKKVSRREAKRLPMNYNFAEDDKDKDAYNLEDVQVKSDECVTVFTDGASSKNGRVGAAAGIGIFWGPNHPLNTSMRLPGRQTNNRAEIYAATHALHQAKSIGAKNVKLYTDSQFMIRGINEWIHKWKKNGWKLANGDPVKNKDDFIELDKAREGLNVEFIYIKAHDNNPGNVEADRLAVEGARKDLEDTCIFLV